MITLDPEDNDIREARLKIDEAIEALKKAVREHDVNEPSMYKYVETHDRVEVAKKRLMVAYMAFGRTCYEAL